MYDVLYDWENHPVHEPSGDGAKKVDTERAGITIQKGQQDAYVIKQKHKKKRDGKFKMKMEKRLFRTLRLKPSTINFNMEAKKAKIKFYNMKDIDNSYRARNPNIRIIQRGEDLNDLNQSDDENQAPALVGKRYAKMDEELRSDILNLFKKKQLWTMDEIKREMPDQPDKPVE